MIDIQKAQKQLSRRDPKLATLIKKHPIDFSPQMKRSPFESLVRAIAHQQLHSKAAETILGRFIDLYKPLRFPKPELIIKTNDEKLRACGFSGNKIKSIKDIAQKAVDKVIPSSAQIKKLSNDEIIDRLTQIYGVGQWTVEMLLIFQLGRLDVWPADDFGVRRGYQVWLRKKEMPSAKALRLIEKKYAPYQSIVALHLWKASDAAKLKSAK